MSHETDADVVRVYCAGPLFNKAERSEMSAIADVLGEAGYKVYLPHRDGMEFRLILNILVERGWPAPTAAHFLHAAIFALDVYQLAVECDQGQHGQGTEAGRVATCVCDLRWFQQGGWHLHLF